MQLNKAARPLFLLWLAACNAAPSGGVIAITPAAPSTEEDLVLQLVEDAVDPNGGDTVSYDIVWSVDGQQVGDLDGADRVPADRSHKGQVWTVLVTPRDDKAAGLSLDASVTVLNSPPIIVSGSLSPEDPSEYDDVVASLQVQDADNDAISLSYAWFVGGVPVGEDSDTLTSDNFAKDDEIYLVVTPNDGEQDGATWASDQVTSINTPPSIEAVTIEPSGPITQTSELTCVPRGWDDVDGDEEAYLFAWMVDGVASGSTRSLTGAAFAKGASITCTATPTDGEDDGDSKTSSEVNVINTAPTLGGATLEPTEPREGDTLTPLLHEAKDIDGDTVDFTYEWFVNGSSVGESDTLASDSWDKGDAVYCTVTPADDEDAGESVTSDTVTVVNTAPVLDKASLKGPVLASSKELTVLATGSDVDGDVLTYTAEWYVASKLHSETSLTLPGPFVKGQDIYAQVTANDGDMHGISKKSDVVTVANTPPEVDAITIDGPLYASTKTTSVTASGTDIDGDSLTWSFAWYLNGKKQTGTADSIGVVLKRGDEVYVIATVSDGDDTATKTSDTVTVSNSLPVISKAVISPSAPKEGQTVTAAITAADADSDTLSFIYAWRVNGSVVAKTSTLISSHWRKGDKVSLDVMANDGRGNSALFSSNTVTIANSPPTVVSTTISPSKVDARVGKLTASTVAKDPDGDKLVYQHAWYLNGKKQTGTADSIGVVLKRGDEAYVIATVSDGDDTATKTSDTVTVSNSLPVISKAVISPSAPREGQTVTAAITAADADSDTLSFIYAWRVNGSVVAKTSTLISSHWSKGDKVSLDVMANDGRGNSALFSSNTVTIANSPPTIVSTTISPSKVDARVRKLTASTVAKDPDGDKIVYQHAWYLNGRKQSTSNAVFYVSLARGDTVYVLTTASDGTLQYTLRSATTTVVNAPPVISRVVLSPGNPTVRYGIIKAIITATDADSDPMWYTYRWYVNGKFLNTHRDLLASNYSKGDKVYVDVTPTDRRDSGAVKRSNTEIVRNSPPVISKLSIPSSVYASWSYVPATTIASDEDGDKLTYTYQWRVDRTLQTSTTSRLPGPFKRGQVIDAYVTVSDGSAKDVAATRTTVKNSKPTSATLAISPVTPIVTSNLTCKVTKGATDVDGDTITYNVYWYRDGRFWSGRKGSSKLVGDTIYNSDTKAGEVWKCQVYPHDGLEAGPSSDVSVTIGSWPGKATFSDCGQTGQRGPSHTQCTAAYAKTPLSGKVTVRGSYQEWTVPFSGTFRIEAWGAEGGGGGRSAAGGKGARMRGDIKLTKGEVLQITVGQRGSNRGFGSGGGGGTYVMKKTGGVPLVIAGGGGGSGHITTVGKGGTTGSCGTSGGSTNAGKGGCAGLGGDSGDGAVGSYNNSGGGAGYKGSGIGNGTLTNPGLSWAKGATGGPDTGGFGGAGGGIQHLWSCRGNGGGSGGGGYSGGGGGGGNCSGEGGGGGSYNVGSSASNSSGVRTGDGQVVIDVP